MRPETKRALLTTGEDLWARHKVVPVDSGDGTPYVLQFLQAYEPTTLNKLVADEHQGQMEARGGHPFSLSDLEQRRVGFVGWRDVSRYVNAIECRPISWAQIMLLDKLEVRRQIPNTEYAHALGTSVLVETSDERLILVNRSQNVATFPGAVHVSAAGYIDYDGAAASRSFLTQAYRELFEEMGLAPHEVRLTHLGVVMNTMHECGAIEVCFLAEVHMPARAVLNRAKNAQDAWEGNHRAYCAQDAVNLLESRQFVPTGAGCLLLALGL